MFDKLALMVKGRMAYFGRASDALQYFADLNMPCPERNYNPTDHFLNMLYNEKSAAILVEKHEPRVIAGPVAPKDLEDGSIQLELIADPVPAPSRQLSKLVPNERYVLPWWQQFTTLYKRSFIVNWRSFNPASIIVTMFIAIFIGLCAIRKSSLDLNDDRM